MEEILDRIEERGVKHGEKLGMVKYCVEKQKMTPKQISDEIDMTENEVNEIISELTKKGKLSL